MSLLKIIRYSSLKLAVGTCVPRAACLAVKSMSHESDIGICKTSLLLYLLHGLHLQFLCLRRIAVSQNALRDCGSHPSNVSLHKHSPVSKRRNQSTGPVHFSRQITVLQGSITVFRNHEEAMAHSSCCSALPHAPLLQGALCSIFPVHKSVRVSDELHRLCVLQIPLQCVVISKLLSHTRVSIAVS